MLSVKKHSDMDRYFTHKFPNIEGCVLIINSVGCVLIINSVGMDSISFNV